MHQIILAKEEEMASRKSRKHFFFQRKVYIATVDGFLWTTFICVRDEQFVEIYANLSSVLNQQSTFISLAIPNRLCLPRSLYSRYVCPSDDSSRHLGFIGRKTQFLTEFFFICAHMEFWVFVLAKVSPLFPYISKKNYCVFIQHSFQLLIFRTLDLQIQK